MFEVMCTGKNLNYGKEKEKRMLGENYLVVALKNNWIENTVKYAGNFQRGILIKPQGEK